MTKRRKKSLRSDQRPDKPRKVAKKHEHVTVDTPLTQAEKVFIAAYLVNLNATQAYFKAHPDCAYSTASTEGCRLLGKPNVKAQIDAELERRKKQYEISADNVLKELARIAFFDPARVLNDDGSVKRLDEMDEDTRRVVASVEVEELFEGRGEDREQIGYTRKLKYWPKADALKAFMQHLGIQNPAPSGTPKPGDPNTVTHFHTAIPFDDIRKRAEQSK